MFTTILLYRQNISAWTEISFTLLWQEKMPNININGKIKTAKSEVLKIDTTISNTWLQLN
jgi:hypothetical protein